MQWAEKIDNAENNICVRALSLKPYFMHFEHDFVLYIFLHHNFVFENFNIFYQRANFIQEKLGFVHLKT